MEINWKECGRKKDMAGFKVLCIIYVEKLKETQVTQKIRNILLPNTKKMC